MSGGSNVGHQAGSPIRCISEIPRSLGRYAPSDDKRALVVENKIESGAPFWHRLHATRGAASACAAALEVAPPGIEPGLS